MTTIKTAAERLKDAHGIGHPADFYQAEIADLRAALEQKTCATCKFYEAPGVCDNLVVYDIINSLDSFHITPQPTFGCIHWART